LSSIKKYTYPGSKIAANVITSGTDFKIFSPKYTKKYDSKSKMDCILISGIVTMSSENNLKIFKGTIGVNLKTKDKIVYAYSNNSTTAKLNEITINDITKVQLNEIDTYMKNKYGEAAASKIIFGNTKAASATSSAPAALGSTYTYNGLYNYKKDSVIGTFAITINSVTDSTFDEAKSMGYKGPINEGIEFKLVNITWDVIKAEITKGNGSIYTYKDFIGPIFRGSSVPGVDYINTVTDSGFADILKSKIDELQNDKIKSNSATSFTVTGNVILPVIKGYENYMVFVVKGEENPNLDRIYFKIK
ncbi:MAG TPA: hypothetical protein DHW61_04385, partial [Lachnoclostridium phytofermentans]